MNNKVLLVIAVLVIGLSVSGAFFYNLTRQNNQKISGGLNLPTLQANQASVSYTTVTVTETTSETILATYGPGGSTSQSSTQNISTSSQTTFTTTGSPIVVSATSCDSNENGSICVKETSSEYVAFLQNIPGTDCTYGPQNSSYRINGTVLAYWDVFQTNDTMHQYFAIHLVDFYMEFQNGTIFRSGFHTTDPLAFTGDVPVNITRFSLLSSHEVVLDTSSVNLNFNPCFPNSLLVKPVVASG